MSQSQYHSIICLQFLYKIIRIEFQIIIIIIILIIIIVVVVVIVAVIIPWSEDPP